MVIADPLPTATTVATAARGVTSIFSILLTAFKFAYEVVRHFVDYLLYDLGRGLLLHHLRLWLLHHHLWLWLLHHHLRLGGWGHLLKLLLTCHRLHHSGLALCVLLLLLLVRVHIVISDFI